MKKVSLIVLILLGNLSLISCTGESLAEIMNSPNLSSTDGEKEQVEPKEQPPEEEP
ncbi:hypothetical protein LZ575_17675 [Antarcticibacterium sp. 1MA-6-2]|uniref:hypothetical protein n=1 Tax=Antarcticibacterium sp. 1MA-6-2 TaxID=2908210 RepID=UPI001F391CF0|nr:hypothetical protein [Antarcticibacterium sp. 1MA-6-2]UJH90594.1 hypothetical protein LZ575_17675 [Antarcticibacterium sp. 1MA-6-2]